MIKKAFFSVIVLMLSIYSTQAQYGYMPGYVITTTGDTLYGEIKDRNALPNILFDKVKFKPANGGKKVSFAATQIKAYKKGDEYFESITCFLDTAVFVKVVNEGFLSLYKYEYGSFENTSGFGSTFLLKKEDNPCVLELSSSDYKNQLLDYFNDCNLVQEKIKEREVNNDQLADIVNIYNQNHIK